MQPAAIRPRAQLFVCTNARASGDPLTSGCGAHGPAVYASIKRAVSAAGRVADVWVTRTQCLGHCPPDGCSVVLQPGNGQYINVTADDATALVALATRETR